MDEKLTQLFLTFCKTNKFEINPKQKEIIVMLENFIFSKKNFLKIFKKKRKILFLFIWWRRRRKNNVIKFLL